MVESTYENPYVYPKKIARKRFIGFTTRVRSREQHIKSLPKFEMGKCPKYYKIQNGRH